MLIAEVLGLDADAWQAVIGAAGVPLIVGSVVVLIVQVRRETDTARASVHQSITDSMIEVDRLFFENPQYRRYFYEDAEPPADGEERVKVEVLAELMLDFLDNCVTQQHRLESGMAEKWMDYVNEVLDTSPVMRGFLAEHGHWYCDELEARGKAEKERLEADAPTATATA